MNFESEVLESKTPVVVDFYADWCGPCKVISPVLERLEKAYGGKFRLVKVNVERERELAAEFEIQLVPTILFFKNGKPVASQLGAPPESMLREKIDKLVS